METEFKDKDKYKLICACIVAKGKLFIGRNHENICTEYEINKQETDYERGFLDEQGRFINESSPEVRQYNGSFDEHKYVKKAYLDFTKAQQYANNLNRHEVFAEPIKKHELANMREFLDAISNYPEGEQKDWH